MKKLLLAIFTLGLFLNMQYSSAQIAEKPLGAWYMYFYDTSFKDSAFGVQGDLQYRNWNIVGDLEQLLIRSGLTYKPKNSIVKLTLGYGNITTGAYSIAKKSTSTEHRIYQEALFGVLLGKRIYTKHRFRLEQRFVEKQDFRFRYRYNIFVTIPINKAVIETKTIYLALYNELFINGQRNIGNGKTVEIFDRNRLYAGLGYGLCKNTKLQIGFLNQTTNSWNKNQLQCSLHHSF